MGGTKYQPHVRLSPNQRRSDSTFVNLRLLHLRLSTSHVFGGMVNVCDLQEDFGLMEEGLGFERFLEGDDRLGWLFNYNAVRSQFPGLSHSCMQQQSA